MATKNYLSNEDIMVKTAKLCDTITESGFAPDIIVPIARGGLYVGLLMSHYFKCNLQALHWSTRDISRTESNCWLAEDAADDMNILIVDDLSDTGTTFSQIIDDWEQSVINPIRWHENVKFATLQIRHNTNFTPDYYVDTLVDDTWQVYPWESFEERYMAVDTNTL